MTPPVPFDTVPYGFRHMASQMENSENVVDVVCSAEDVYCTGYPRRDRNARPQLDRNAQPALDFRGGDLPAVP
jgi:hypothetical protein